MKKTMKKNKKELSTLEQHVQSLTPKQKEQFDQGYKDVILSELMLAMINKDHEHVLSLAKEIGISSKKIQSLHANEQHDYNFHVVFKILRQLGCTKVKLEYHGKDIDITLPSVKKSSKF